MLENHETCSKPQNKTDTTMFKQTALLKGCHTRDVHKQVVMQRQLGMVEILTKKQSFARTPKSLKQRLKSLHPSRHNQKATHTSTTSQQKFTNPTFK